MASGWQVLSATSGVHQPTQAQHIGDNRTWNVAIPGKDLTGYSAHWLLGTPPEGQLLGVIPQGYVPPGIVVRKTSGTDLGIIVTGSGLGVVSNLRFTLTRADTIGLQPRTYWQQAIVFDLGGNPLTVAEGEVHLLPSLLPLETA